MQSDSLPCSYAQGLVARLDARLAPMWTVMDSILGSSNIVLLRLVMKAFLQLFPPTTDSSRVVVSYLRKNEQSRPCG